MHTSYSGIIIVKSIVENINQQEEEVKTSERRRVLVHILQLVIDSKIKLNFIYVQLFLTFLLSLIIFTFLLTLLTLFYGFIHLLFDHQSQLIQIYIFE